jgi:hypothetical protein
MYTAELRNLIKKVEETRPRRLGGEEFRRMTADEKKDVLERFHPDHVKDGFSTLQVGKNKGELAPKELAVLLQAQSRIKDVSLDLDSIDYDVDVLIIGGGGAGASAALMAHEEGAKPLIVTKLRFGDSNTVMAQGGIQAATLPYDSPSIHYLDTMGGGHYTNSPELIYNLVLDAPKVINWLAELGVMFDKEDDGMLKPVHGGGTSRRRMHPARDYSGAEIMRVLRDEVQSRGIEVVEFSPAVELILDEEGKAAGAVLYNLETGEYRIARAKTVILSMGGSGRLHYQGLSHHQPQWSHGRRAGNGLPCRRRAQVYRLNPVSPHRRCFSAADFGPAGD